MMGISLLDDLTKRSQLFLDATLDGLVLLDTNGVIIQANELYSQMIGYEMNELIASIILCLHPNDSNLKQFPEDVDQLLTGEGLRHETTHVLKNGSSLYLDFGSFWIQIGGKDYLANSFRNITLQKSAEGALRWSETH